MSDPTRFCVFCGRPVFDGGAPKYLQGLPLVLSSYLLASAKFLTAVCEECRGALTESLAATYAVEHTEAAPNVPPDGTAVDSIDRAVDAAHVAASDALVRSMSCHKRLRSRRRFGIPRFLPPHPWAGLPTVLSTPPPQPGPEWAIIWRRSLDLLEWVPFWISIECGFLRTPRGREPYERIILDRPLLERWEVAALLERMYSAVNDLVLTDPTFAACIVRDAFNPTRQYFDSAQLMGWLVEQYAATSLIPWLREDESA